MGTLIREVTDPFDTDVERFADLLKATFADQNICLGADRMQEFLAASPGPERSFHLLVVRDGDEVLGGTLFSSIARTAAGFSEYMVLSPSIRGKGVSRLLFEGRRAVLDRAAQARGMPAATGIFIEVESPLRTPEAFVEHERITAIDIVERRRYFKHLGFYQVDIPYQQPPLGAGQAPVDYLDLLFQPWDPGLKAGQLLSPDFIVQSLRPIFCSWSPQTCEETLQRLQAFMGGRPRQSLPLES